MPTVKTKCLAMVAGESARRKASSMKNITRTVTISGFILAATAAISGPVTDSYWPLHNGDYKTFVYQKTKELTLDVASAGGNQYEVSFDAGDDGSGYEIHAKTSTGILMEELGVGWTTVAVDPGIFLMDDTLLQNGGSHTTSTTVSQTGLDDYSATFTIKIAKLGSVTVPAGTFTDCRSFTVTEKATIPGYGKRTATAMTVILAPRVGLIKKLVKSGMWAELSSGMVGGVDVRNVPPPPSITTSSPLPSGTFGTTYSTTLLATAGVTPLKWALATGSKLPTGLKLNATTGVISGKPTKAGTANFTVKVTDAKKQVGTKPFTVTVN